MDAMTEEEAIEAAIREAEEHYEQELAAAASSGNAGAEEQAQKVSSNLPCKYCGSLSVDDKMFRDFGVCVCFPCKLAHREEYKCISKSRAMKEYLLNDEQLSKLRSATVSNPNKIGWQDMRLYLVSQVKREAERKWGSLEELEEEKKRRAEARLAQKQNKSKKPKRSLLDPIEEPSLGSSLIEKEIKRQKNAAALGDADKTAIATSVKAKPEPLPDVFRATKTTHVHTFGPERPSKRNPNLVVTKCTECGFKMINEVF